MKPSEPSRRSVNITHPHGRRAFLRSTGLGMAAGATSFGFLEQLRPVSAADAALDVKDVRFGDDIEPTVQLIENTPRESLIEEVATRIKQGKLSYRELLAALLLAGVRNVQPRPSVGFKFHAVLVVNSCHLASLASSDQDRWLPIFWGLDYFKSSQARDVREGNWTMAAVDESRLPSPQRTKQAFVEAMDQWDEEAADVAAAGMVRHLPSNEIFEVLARYAARDFRSIGHKAIYVANAYRTLNCIGWQYAEPVVRSLAYALLNHEGQPNPSQSDLVADRPWRQNLERVASLPDAWSTGEISNDATLDMLGVVREGTYGDAGKLVAQQLKQAVSPQSVIDGLMLSAGELLMRQPGIVGLHTLTTTNAIRYLYATATDPQTRVMLLMQNASFLTMFRDEMQRRGDVGEHRIDALEPMEDAPRNVGEIFETIGSSKMEAARKALTQVGSANDAKSFIDEARRLIFLKGNDSHDYKFSSAVLEDYHHISPAWRHRYLAASVFQLRGAGARTLPLIERVRSALDA